VGPAEFQGPDPRRQAAAQYLVKKVFPLWYEWKEAGVRGRETPHTSLCPSTAAAERLICRATGAFPVKLAGMTDDLLLLIFTSAALAGGYKIWQISLDAREAANRIAKDTCSRAVVQFLDGTVAFAGFRLTRDNKGRRRLLRTYTFDYTSDGFERAQGFIVLAGLRLEAVGLAGTPS
jgi:Protein of unknown function (DUF3301)